LVYPHGTTAVVIALDHCWASFVLLPFVGHAFAVSNLICLISS